MARRYIVVALALAALAGHAIALAAGRALLSNLIELLMAALAAAVCFQAAARASGFARSFWRYLAAALSIYTLGQAFYAYYDSILHASVLTWWPSDLLLFFYVAPVAMALFLGEDSAESRAFRWQRTLDFLQIGIVTLSGYLIFFYFPWQAHEQVASVQLLTWRVENIRNVLLTAAFLIRAGTAHSRLVRSLFGRVTVFLALFSISYAIYVYLETWGHMPDASWYELLWTVPRMILIGLVAGWDPPAEAGPPHKETAKETLVLAQFAHIALPLLVLAMARYAVGQQLKIAVAAVMASFACSSLRLVLSQRAQQKALERTRSLQEKYRLLFERNRAGVFRSTLDGRILECNESFAAILGYSREELINMPAHLLYPGGKAERDARIADFRRVGSYSNYEICFRRKDGGLAWVIQNLTLTRDEQGIEITEGTAVDITPRKLAEKEVSAWKNRYDAAVRASGLVLFEWDPATRETTFGGALEDVLGYDVEEFQNKSREWRRLIHPDDLTRYVEIMQRAVDDHEPFGLEYRVRAKNGSYRSMRERGQVIVPFGGNAPRMVGFIADVTEQRDLEVQLRQSQKMEAVGRLAGGVAHDFNNLLTVISGYAELLLEGGDPASAVHKDAKEIRAAARRAAALTHQLLAFSRQQILQPKVLDLNEIIRETERMLTRLIGEDIEMRTVLASDLGQVEADPGQLEQILMNLVINSRDAMPQGGKLTIATSNVRLDADYTDSHPYVTPGDYVCLAVSDTGVGMDAETCSRIFEPFYTTKEVGKGTGLGLSTVYGIVKQSRGHIEVYSEPGRGTTFKIYLPRKLSLPSNSGLQRPAASGGSERILLVEDDAQLRELTTAVLAAQGYAVFAAGSVEEVSAICARHNVDLLLTDVVMPKTSGKEIAQTVSARFPGVKTLYMSGYTTDAVVHHGVLEEGIFFLQKPFTPAALAAKVREVLDAETSTAKDP